MARVFSKFLEFCAHLRVHRGLRGNQGPGLKVGVVGVTGEALAGALPFDRHGVEELDRGFEGEALAARLVGVVGAGSGRGEHGDPKAAEDNVTPVPVER